MNKVVAGNWKMNHGPAGALRFLRVFPPPPENVDVILFPPAISLSAAREALGGRSRIALGVQNVHEASSGAFTGEIAAGMAAEAGATHALVGHSERRHIFGESDDRAGLKLRAIQSAGLVPVLCVGETLDERRAGRLGDVIVRQLEGGLGVSAARQAIADGAPLFVAYEPVWAIGTGETSTPSDASEAHGILRERLRELTGAGRAARIPILYGGSVTPENAATLLSARDIDGVLVGGASLEPSTFARIVEAAVASS